MDKARHKCSQFFGWEETSDIDEAVQYMTESVVPDDEFDGVVRITVEYIPRGE